MAKKKTAKHNDPRLRHVRKAMRLIQVHGVPVARLIMTEKELSAALQAVREASAFVRHSRARRKPTSFTFAGGRFPLAYSSLGRIFVCDNQGNRLLASGYDVL